jgi:hypothetical protein
MSARPVDAIFQVTRVTIVTSGTPNALITAEATTRGDRPEHMVAVTVGDLLVYCYDLTAVRGFADAWEEATLTIPAELPVEIEDQAVNRHDLGIVVRVDGAPTKRVLGHGAATNPTGRAHVAVMVGPLLVLAFDQASVTAWAGAWRDALGLATALWGPGSEASDPHLRSKRRHALATQRTYPDSDRA